MKKTILTLNIFALFFLTQCCKDVSKTNPEYIGYWASNSSSSNTVYGLLVNASGKGEWASTTSSGFSTKTASASGSICVKDGNLKVGLKKFTINTAPLYNSTTLKTTMTLSNVEYIKQ